VHLWTVWACAINAANDRTMAAQLFISASLK
jgi:hypothetical protein